MSGGLRPIIKKAVMDGFEEIKWYMAKTTSIFVVL
jgi:hypothetical protein